MSTRAAADRRGAAERLREILSHPLELVIDGAVAYWLEDDAGHRLSQESSRTIESFACALELHQMGRDPESMLLCARLEDGERYEVGGGPYLIDMAEAAAGIPARPRHLRRT